MHSQFFLIRLLKMVLIQSFISSLLATSEDPAEKLEKRLETVDGVEIASSYREYMDLALSDLEDRLVKSNSKLVDFNGRIEKRQSLLNKIKDEIARRKDLSDELTVKEKDVRNKLIKNTAMKSAIQNLADIAGYYI